MFLLCSRASAIVRPCPTPTKLTPADPSNLANALAYALRFHGRNRIHNADEMLGEIVARRLVEHLERAGFNVLKHPPEVGSAVRGRGFKG